MRSQGKAPTTAVYVICLILYLVALAGHFAIVHIDPRITDWSWICLLYTSPSPRDS